MLLDTIEAAQLLDVDEKTLLRWIKKDGLPATFVNDIYRINRADLLEWATDRGIKVKPEIYAAADTEVPSLPTLLQALEAGGIHCNVPGTDKLGVLKNVVNLLQLPPQVDREFVLQVLLAREALGTTAIGDGIAIPHVRNPILLHVSAPAVTLCFLETPIDFNALDGKPVRILFTLTSPSAKVHLHLLSKLAYALRDRRLRELLQDSCDPTAIKAAIAEIENELGR